MSHEILPPRATTNIVSIGVRAVEDRWFLIEVLMVPHGSQLTTFVFWSPPRNASIPVKTGGVLMPFRWGCGGQEVPDRGLDDSRGS